MRDISIEFVAGGKTTLCVRPRNINDPVQPRIPVINLAPKEWSRWNFFQEMSPEEVLGAKDSDQAFFAATYPSGRRRRILMKTFERSAAEAAGKGGAVPAG